MATYYVDPVSGNNGNSGDVSNPWKTLDYACSYSSLAAGDTIYAVAGTYAEQVTIATKSGTAGNPINLISLGGPQQAIIDGSYTIPGGSYASGTTSTFSIHAGGTFDGLGFVYAALLEFSNVAGWIVDGFVIKRSRGRSIEIFDSDDIIIRNCVLDGARHASVWVRGDDNILEDCEVTDGGNFAPVSRGSGAMDWPVMINYQGGSAFTVQRCYVHHGWGEGIAGRNGTGYKIHDNFFYDNYALNVYAHLNSDVEIYRNVIWHSTGNAMNRGGGPSADIVVNMESQNFPGATPADNFKIRNNLIVTRSSGVSFWNNQGGGFTTGYIDFLNNTIIAYNGGKPFSAITSGSTHSNTIVRNNIFLGDGNGAAYSGTTINQNFSFSNNMWSKAPPGPVSGSGDIIGKPNLDNPITPIPEFAIVSPGNYLKIAGSLGIEKGTTVADAVAQTTGAANDYFGNSRGSTPDMGFDQFGAVSEGTATEYFVSTSGNNTTGLSEATAWNELDQIAWGSITAGDTITLVGPDTFTTTLQPTKSGTASDPITIKTNGSKIYIRGSRGTTLMDEAGTTGLTAETHTENGVYIEDSYIILDGIDYHGITIEGWQGHGIRLRKESSNCKIRNVEVRNCGYVEMKTDWTGGGIVYSGTSAAYPNGAGIRWGGAQHEFYRVISHDNGQDAIQSEHGDDNNIGNTTFDQCWLYNNRPHTIANARPIGGANSESFNYASHTDGIQIYSGGNVQNITMTNCVIGPGLTQGLILGQTGTGGSTELIDTNPDAESGTTDWAFDDGSSGYLATNANTGDGSATSWRPVMTNTSGIFYRSPDFSITSGNSYTLSFDGNTQATGKDVIAYVHDSAAAMTSHYGLNGASWSLPQYGWATYSVEFTANATKTDARLSFDLSNFDNGDIVRFDNISIVGSGEANTSVSNFTMENCLVTNNQDSGILGYPAVVNDNWTIKQTTIHSINSKDHVIMLEGNTVTVEDSIFDGDDTGADINFVTANEPDTSINNYQREAGSTDIIGTEVTEEIFSSIGTGVFDLNDYTVVNANVTGAGCGGTVEAILGVGGVTGPDSYGSFTFVDTTGLLVNGNFENQNYLTGWEFFDNGGGSVTEVSGANSTASAPKMTVGSGNNSQIRQSDLAVTIGQTYKVTFYGYSSSGANVDVKLFMQNSPFTNYGLDESVNLGTSWAQHEKVFTATSTSDIARLQFRFDKYASSGDIYYIDEVTLEPYDASNDVVSSSSAIKTGTAIGLKLGVN